MKRELAIIGAGGHAKVAISTAIEAGFSIVGCYDDEASLHGKRILGIPVLGPIALLGSRKVEAVIALGNNRLRKEIALQLSRARWATLVHPRAVVHASVKIGAGTVIFAGAVVQPDTEIGAHAILNTSASVDHDCRIRDFVHLAPGVSLSGGVQIGEGSLIGIGSSVIPLKKIGTWVTIGAGSAVVKDIPDHITAFGTPARVQKAHEKGNLP